VPYREDRPSAPLPQQITAEPFTFTQAIPAQVGPAAGPGRGFDPKPDFSLGQNFGLVPQAESCGNRLCEFRPGNSALGVGQALLLPRAAKGIAVESGQLTLAIIRNNRAAKAALDTAGVFRPALNSAGKIQPASFATGRFLSWTSFFGGPASQFAFGFTSTQADPGQVPLPATPSAAFKAGRALGEAANIARHLIR
jgi:hypothetical protein